MKNLLQILTKKSLLALAAVSFAGNLAIAQEQLPKVVCGTEHYFQQSLQKNSQIQKLQNNLDEQADVLQYASRAKRDDSTIIVIPVVFHVLYDGPTENISKNAIQQQLITLNETFRGKNKSISNVSEPFKNLVADARIEFRLATKDPWGRCTDGIDRIQTPLTVNATDNVKPLAWWDSRMYLNIWVVKNIGINVGGGGIVAGYSKFPWDAAVDPANDGIVMDHRFIGRNQTTLTHEVGHYLGLYHTFQGGCTEDERLQGDHVMDTPPAAEANYGCKKGTNSCEAGEDKLPDMLENFMDYTDCRYMFTGNQKVRMRWYMGNPRGKLWSAENHRYVFQECTSAPLSINETETENQVIIYPNPARSSFKLSINAYNAFEKLTVYEITGKQLSEVKLTANYGYLEQGFSCEKLGIHKPGIYLLQLQSAQNTSLVKLVVE